MDASVSNSHLKRKLAALFASTIALTFYAGVAHATVITFDLLPHATNLPNGGIISTQGFNFSRSASIGGSPIVVSTYCGPPCPDNGTQALVNFNAFPQVTITMWDSGGDTFSLNRFDGAESHANLPTVWTDRIFVEGHLNGGGSVNATFPLDLIHDGPGGLADFQTFYLPATFTNLTSATFTGLINPLSPGRNDFTLDNIHVNEGFDSVPEPITLALLGLGLAGLGFARRRLRL